MRRKIPSIQALLCFEAAARHESYTRAAQELALSQSAVTRQVAQLEDFLQTRLFRRTRHGVSLTPAGQDYARHIGQRLDAIERDTRDIMSGHDGGGVIHLAVVPSFATHWLIPRLSDLARTHPDITVHIETRTRPFLFADGVMDAALYAGTPAQVANWPGTRADVLMEEEVIPVCSPELLRAHGAPTGNAARTPTTRARRTATAATPKALSAQALARLPLLQQSTRPEGWRHWFDAMQVQAPEALAGPRFELFSMLAVAAKHGLGVALMPRLLIAGELSRGELVVACERPLRGQRHYCFITPKQTPERGVVTRFRDWLLAQAAGTAAAP